MPLRIPNDSLPRDVLQYCVAPAASHALLLAGAAKVFTAINPVNAGMFGIVWTITDYVLDKLLPNLYENPDANFVIRYSITCLSSYAIATAATNALGFSLSISEILTLSAGTGTGVLGVGFIVYLFAKRFFVSHATLANNFVEVGATLGNSFSVVIGAATAQCVIDCVNNCTSLRNSSSQVFLFAGRDNSSFMWNLALNQLIPQL